MPDAKPTARELHDFVHAFILKEFLPGTDASELADDTPLITGGILDSLATVKTVAALEDKYGIEIKPHEASAAHMDTVAAITALMASKTGAK